MYDGDAVTSPSCFKDTTKRLGATESWRIAKETKKKAEPEVGILSWKERLTVTSVSVVIIWLITLIRDEFPGEQTWN